MIIGQGTTILAGTRAVMGLTIDLLPINDSWIENANKLFACALIHLEELDQNRPPPNWRPKYPSEIRQFTAICDPIGLNKRADALDQIIFSAK